MAVRESYACPGRRRGATGCGHGPFRPRTAALAIPAGSRVPARNFLCQVGSGEVVAGVAARPRGAVPGPGRCGGGRWCPGAAGRGWAQRASPRRAAGCGTAECSRGCGCGRWRTAAAPGGCCGVRRDLRGKAPFPSRGARMGVRSDACSVRPPCFQRAGCSCRWEAALSPGGTRAPGVERRVRNNNVSRDWSVAVCFHRERARCVPYTFAHPTLSTVQNLICTFSVMSSFLWIFLTPSHCF